MSINKNNQMLNLSGNGSVERNRYTHTFTPAWEYEGKTYEKLTFDWSKLTFADCLAIENEMLASGLFTPTPELTGEFHIRMASRACTDTIGCDIIRAMPMSDNVAIRKRARAVVLRTLRNIDMPAKKYVHVFAEPWAHKGCTYTELTFDWSRLTGNDSLDIERELLQIGIASAAPEFTGEYHIRMAMRACDEGINLDTIRAMTFEDGMAINRAARSFFL